MTINESAKAEGHVDAKDVGTPSVATERDAELVMAKPSPLWVIAPLLLIAAAIYLAR